MNLALSGVRCSRRWTEIRAAAQATMHICPSVEYIERAWDDAKYGNRRDRR